MVRAKYRVNEEKQRLKRDRMERIARIFGRRQMKYDVDNGFIGDCKLGDETHWITDSTQHICVYQQNIKNKINVYYKNIILFQLSSIIVLADKSLIENFFKKA